MVSVVNWWQSSVNSLSYWPSTSVYSTVGARHRVARVCQRLQRLVTLQGQLINGRPTKIDVNLSKWTLRNTDSFGQKGMWCNRYTCIYTVSQKWQDWTPVRNSDDSKSYCLSASSQASHRTSATAAFITHDAGVEFSTAFVCQLSIHSANLTYKMFHDEFWKPIYFGVKRSRSRVNRRGSLHSCEVLSAGFFYSYFTTSYRALVVLWAFFRRVDSRHNRLFFTARTRMRKRKMTSLGDVTNHVASGSFFATRCRTEYRQMIALINERYMPIQVSLQSTRWTTHITNILTVLLKSISVNVIFFCSFVLYWHCRLK